MYKRQERISLDLEQIFHSARNLEKQYPNTDRDFYQAVSNLWFFDRLSLLIAKFQDTHLQIQPLMEMPHIRLGIEIVPLANGNYMLSSIDSNLQNKLEKQGVSLEVGDLIYEVNDLAIHEEVAKLQKYIPSSSKNYAFTKAVQSLTSRNFKYPKSPRMKITYRNGSGEIKKANLKWTYTYNYKRSDALYYLDYLGFEFRWHDSSDGNNQHPPISDILKNTKEWYSYQEPTVLMQRTGIIDLKGKKAGVLQIFSFHDIEVIGEKNSVVRSWDSPIIDFLKLLKKRNLPLILDLRNNQGGIVELPLRLMSLIAKSGEEYPSYIEGFRMTAGIQQMWQRVSGDENDLFNDVAIASQLRMALKNGQKYSGVWDKSEDITADKELGGFNQEIIALTTSSCISACDILSILLESSARATFIGSATNGTGSGYFSWEPYEGSQYVDVHEIFKLEIPNMLFGHGLKNGPKYQLSEKATLKFNRENRPVVPHIPYKSTSKDYLNGDLGWFELALSIL